MGQQSEAFISQLDAALAFTWNEVRKVKSSIGLQPQLCTGEQRQRKGCLVTPHEVAVLGDCGQRHGAESGTLGLGLEQGPKTVSHERGKPCLPLSWSR